MPGLGEIPAGTNLPVYFHLENTTDSSGNGFTLTNHNTVTFGTGRFTNAADFGSSGTNKALECTEPFGGAMPSLIDIHFWFKLNSTANFGTPKRFFVLSRSSASGYLIYCEYTIVLGVLNLFCVLTNNTPGTATATTTITADTSWHYLRCGRNAREPFIRVDNKPTVSAGGTGTGDRAGASNTLTIGNNNAKTTQCFAMIDEFFISNPAYDQGQLYRYYQQARYGFCV